MLKKILTLGLLSGAFARAQETEVNTSCLSFQNSYTSQEIVNSTISLQNDIKIRHSRIEAINNAMRLHEKKIEEINNTIRLNLSFQNSYTSQEIVNSTISLQNDIKIRHSRIEAINNAMRLHEKEIEEINNTIRLNSILAVCLVCAVLINITYDIIEDREIEEERAQYARAIAEARVAEHRVHSLKKCPERG